MEERHRRPPSTAEFESMLEFMASVTENTPCWSVCTDKDEVVALKSLDLDTGVIRVKTRGMIRNVPPEVAFICIYDTEIRAQWDKHFRFFRTFHNPGEAAEKDKANEGLDVIYACVHAPIGCADREFVEWRMCRRRGRDFRVYLRSCDFEGVPEVGKGRVRADVIASGYVIHGVNERDTEIIIYSQVDIKGAIPKTIINTLAPSAPLKWIRKLRAACDEFMHQNIVKGSTPAKDQLDRLVNETLQTSTNS
jgi:hypothetical protein